MGEVRAECKECGSKFNLNETKMRKLGQIGVGAGIGALVGSSTGIALGSYGTINGGGVGAVVGAGAVALGQKTVVKCPECGEYQHIDEDNNT